MTAPKGLEGHSCGVSLSNAALVIIDMQNDALTMLPMVGVIIPAISSILEAWRASVLPVIFKRRVQRADGVDVERFRIPLFQHKPFLVAGTPGADVVPQLRPQDRDYMVHGARFSGFFQTDLQLVLTRLGVRTLVVCGVQTPNCIRATVMDALAYDYNVIVVDDAVTAQTPAIHQANLLDMRNMGVTIMTASALLGHLEALGATDAA